MSAPQPVGNDQNIGRFQVLRILGQGAEGVVYLACDPKLDRQVAIKTTTIGNAEEQFLADLLLSTASTASRLNHPNIVPVFEVGMHDGSPFVVFEYVEGRTLAQILAADGPLPMARAVVMMSQILSGMALIHDRRLIHGDIKPANILVGADNRARVADFGLLRHEHATDIDHASGTLRYMSPECFDGSVTDCRRDVYALGLLFHEMLTGEPVVKNIGDMDSIIARILHDIPQPPSDRNPAIATEIDTVVLKALGKHPDERFKDAGEMKAALDRFRVPVADAGRVELSHQVVHATVEFLLRRMAHKSDFNALSTSVASINRLTRDISDASIKSLSDNVMRDLALTQKLLRLVNSAAMGNGKVTKVSDAIAILGVGQLRSMATAMMLSNGASGKKSPAIAAALTDAFVAGLVSRNVGRLAGIADVEELFICGMFSLLGELLVLYYLGEEHAEIERRVAMEGVETEAATRAVLGLSFQELAIGVVSHWRFPPDIIKALSPLPAGNLPVPAGNEDRMWHSAAYARELCTLARLPDPVVRLSSLEAHVERFTPLLRMDIDVVRKLMTRSVEVAGTYIAAAGFAASKTPMLEGMSALCEMPDPEVDMPTIADRTTVILRPV